MRHEPDTRAKIDTADARAHLWAGAALGFVLRAMACRRPTPMPTGLRSPAFPGEDPATLKGPQAVAEVLLARLASTAPTGERLRVDA